MNRSFVFVLAVMFLLSCSNNDNEKGSAISENAEEKELKDAVIRHPDSLLLRENLIQYYRDRGNFEMAISATNSAINKDSNNPRLWDIKAILLFEDQDTLASIIAYEKAISIYPSPEYIIALGSQYAQTKNAKALVIADTLISRKVKADKEALFIKGLYYSYINDNEKAISFFDKCLDMDYTFMFAYREKAIVLYNSKKYTEALTVLNRAITLQNNFDEGYYWMGRCLEKLQRVPEAIESYQTALQYDPEFVEAKEALASLGIK